MLRRSVLIEGSEFYAKSLLNWQEEQSVGSKRSFEAFIKPASEPRLVVRPNLARLVCRSGADFARLFYCSAVAFLGKI